MPAPKPNTAAAFVLIDGYFLDVVLVEDHQFASEVTSYPVESGGTVSDNIRILPVAVSMECLVSATPIGFIATQRSSENDNDPPSTAFDILKSIRDERRLVTIQTSLRQYDDMALKNLTIPRATGRGDELRFTAQFQEVQIVSNQRTIIKTATPMGTPNHTKTETPPAADLRKRYNIVQATDAQAGFAGLNYYWYDDDISGWRMSVNTVTTDPNSIGGAVLTQGAPVSNSTYGVVLQKGRPYGFRINAAGYVQAVPGPVIKTDSEIAAAIQREYDATKNDIGFNSPGGNGGNPYNPFASNLNPPVYQIKGTVLKN